MLTNVRCPFIIMGDFNIDLLALPNHKIRDLLLPSLQCVNEPTTDNGSVLDHIYSYIIKQNVPVGVLESYFSDHKPVYIANTRHTDISLSV